MTLCGIDDVLEERVIAIRFDLFDRHETKPKKKCAYVGTRTVDHPSPCDETFLENEMLYMTVYNVFQKGLDIFTSINVWWLNRIQTMIETLLRFDPHSESLKQFSTCMAFSILLTFWWMLNPMVMETFDLSEAILDRMYQTICETHLQCLVCKDVSKLVKEYVGAPTRELVNSREMK